MPPDALLGATEIAGVPCEVEKASAGVIVYAASRLGAEKVARDIRRAVQDRDPRANTTPAYRDFGEPEETRWWAGVNFDWRKI